MVNVKSASSPTHLSPVVFSLALDKTYVCEHNKTWGIVEIVSELFANSPLQSEEFYFAGMEMVVFLSCG